MQHDEPGDALFLLVLTEGLLALVAAYDIVLLAASGMPRDQWVPHAVLFCIASVALVGTCALVDLLPRRSAKRR